MTEQIVGMIPAASAPEEAPIPDLDPAAVEAAWSRVRLARHAQRPRTLDLVPRIFDDFMELHGDRSFRDDPALVGGPALLNGRPVMVIGHQKGNDTESNIHRNFGSAHPEGFRKAQRLMRLADKLGLPLVTFLDTAGAFPGPAAEERGQAEAIASSIKLMTGLQVPIVVVILGEGGSGRRAGDRRGRPRAGPRERGLLGHLPRGLRRDPVARTRGGAHRRRRHADDRCRPGRARRGRSHPPRAIRRGAHRP